MSKLTLKLALSLSLLFALSPLTAEEVVHVLQKGDTLYAISRKYNVPADAIMSWNKLTDPGKLKAGQKLRIPDLYTVQKGETLYGIARKLSIPVETLLSANDLTLKSRIKVGDTLYIPLNSSGSVRAPIPTPDPEISSTAGQSDPSLKPIEDPRSFEKRKVDASMIWPVSVKEIAYLSGKLFGVSITSEKGEKVKAIASGTVISTGPYRGFGQVAFLQSKTGYIYVYGGLQAIAMKPGDKVSFGDEIGNLGADSLSGKPQLYFMVYNKDNPVDPAKAPRGY
jgi:lipoprotein YgeR